MDRRRKARLIGAALLVALAVVVVPELLSGPSPEAPAAAESPQFPASAPSPVRNVTVDLATSKPALLAANALQAPPPLTPPATSAHPPGAMPAPTPAAMPAPTPAALPAPTPGAPTPGAMPAPTPGAMPAPAVATVAQLPAPPQAPQLLQAAAALPVAGSSFAVQLGSFANRRNADNLLHQLKAKGYAVYESNEGAGKNARYRVRVGPLSDRDAAETTIRKLKAEGHDSTLIAP